MIRFVGLCICICICICVICGPSFCWMCNVHTCVACGRECMHACMHVHSVSHLFVCLFQCQPNDRLNRFTIGRYRSMVVWFFWLNLLYPQLDWMLANHSVYTHIHAWIGFVRNVFFGEGTISLCIRDHMAFVRSFLNQPNYYSWWSAIAHYTHVAP